MLVPRLDPIARLRVDLGPTLEVGDVPDGRRRIIPIVGGVVEGPRLSGEVLGIGADWNLRRDPAGTGELSARYAIRTDDGTVITVDNTARFQGPESWPLLTSPRLEAPAGAYEWLNAAVLVGLLEPIGPGTAAVGIELWNTVLIPQ